MNSSPQQVDQLNAEAYRLRHSDTLQALALCQQAHEQALRLDYHQGVCYALLRWGVCSYILGHPSPEVKARLQAALQLAQALDDGQAQVEALNVLAMQHADNGADGLAMQA